MKKVIYISGSGRTATTMWSILISSQLTIRNLSQSRDYFNAVYNRETCSCGRLAYECYETGRKLKHKQSSRLTRKIISYLFTISHITHEFKGFGIVVDSSKSIRHLLLITLITLKRPIVLEFIRPQDEIDASWRRRGRKEDFITKIRKKGVQRTKLLHVLAVLGIIDKKTYDFSNALKDPDSIINDLVKATRIEKSTIASLAKTYKIPPNTQHIFPPADPKYLREVSSIKVNRKLN